MPSKYWSWLACIAICSLLFVAKTEKPPPPWARANGLQGRLDGDIVIDSLILKLVELENSTEAYKDGGGAKRNIVQGAGYLWPGGLVPYVIQSTFDSYPLEKQTIKAAVKKFNSYSCVKFLPRTTEQYYISFIRGSGCYSHVGRRQVAAQPVSIGPGCAKVGTILHEMLHAVGFFHTSSRHDRDAYVHVFLDNVVSSYEHNFWKYKQSEVHHLGAPYDKESLMHPPRLSWSRNGKSTVESRRMPSEVLGRVDDVMSDIDVTQLNALYQCPNTRNCFAWLGMINGEIGDSQISASSHLQYYEPHQARLHLLASSKGFGAWCAAQNQAQNEWLQLDFGTVREICGIATQGKDDIFSPAWVSHYTLRYSNDGYSWVDYSTVWSYGLIGNVDCNSVQYNSLPSKIHARYLRVIPIHWYQEICMRLEVYGC